jgi:hypothetical protein
VVRPRPDRFTPDALLGLDAFCHLEVVFVFDRVTPDRIDYGARHPRNNPVWPRGGHRQPPESGSSAPSGTASSSRSASQPSGSATRPGALVRPRG